MSQEPLLLEISRYSFGFSVVTSTLRRIPILNEVLWIPLLVAWFIGYSSWYVGSLFYDKDHPRKKDSWYGFTEFKQQHQISALLGLIATLLYVVVPTLLIPISWLLTTSNVFWAIGAHHNKKMPNTDDPKYSSAKQGIFVYLTLAVTALSFFTAVEATALFFFPLSAPALIPIATSIEIAVTLLVVVLVSKYTLGNYPPDKLLNLEKTVKSTTHTKSSKEPPRTDVPHFSPLFKAKSLPPSNSMLENSVQARAGS